MPPWWNADTLVLDTSAERCESSSLSEGTNKVNMVREFKFYKDEGGWFVDLPGWEGTKADLAMVSGADTMLDIISQGENDIMVLLSTEEFDGSNRLEFLRESPEMGEGSWYLMKTYIGIE